MRSTARARVWTVGALRLLPLMACLALPALPAGAHSPGVRDEDQAVAHEIEAFREFIKRSIEKRDVQALRKIYADSFTHIHASGRVDDKEARIASALAGEGMIETAPVEDLLFRVFSDHTIIVTGKSRVRDLPNSDVRNSDVRNSRTRATRWMAVYVKIAGEWKFAASQAMRVP